MINSILGMPTGPDVRKLLEHFSDMESLRGTVIEHRTLETIIGIKQEDNRYKTIINAWRGEVEKNTGVVMRGELREVVGIGFRVLTHSEQVSFAGVRKKRAGRQIRKGHVAVANTNETLMSNEMKAQRQHLLIGFAKLHTAVLETRFIPKQIGTTQTNPRADAKEASSG